MASGHDQKQIRSLNEAIRRCRAGFGTAFAFSLALNLLMLVAPLYTLQVFDRVLTSRSTETLVYLTLLAIFAFVIYWGLDIARGRVMVNVGIWLERFSGSSALRASLATALDNKTASTGVLRDLSQVRSFLIGPAVFPVLDAPWTPIFLATIFLLHPFLGWVALCGAIVLLCLGLANDLLTRNLLVLAGQFGSSAQDDVQAAVRNADVIHAMGMIPNVISRWAHASNQSLDRQTRAAKTSGVISASSKSIRMVLQIGIMGLGAWLVLQNELTAGGMIAGSILTARALAPVEQATSLWRSAMVAKASYWRLKQSLGTEQQPVQQVAMRAPEGHLRVEALSFAYPGQKEPVLQNINFELRAGQGLGLIGPTASGKSTLARILVGNLKPRLGHARLDGVDLSSWGSDDRGQYIGYVPQDIELFNGNILENIARLAAPDRELAYSAATIAGVHDDILRLPQGYDTRIGVGGMSLSGGQRQKIGLARAVYGDPKLIVLDEPNTNLDLTGESALVQALEKLRERGSTVVIIVHRPSLLRNVDNILFLRDGSVHMMGPRDNVIEAIRTPAAPTAPSRNLGGSFGPGSGN